MRGGGGSRTGEKSVRKRPGGRSAFLRNIFCERRQGGDGGGKVGTEKKSDSNKQRREKEKEERLARKARGKQKRLSRKKKSKIHQKTNRKWLKRTNELAMKKMKKGASPMRAVRTSKEEGQDNPKGSNKKKISKKGVEGRRKKKGKIKQ